jgi:DNA-binding response OmpR family regulator
MTPLAPVILIVEDEFLLRLDSAETIESAGFEVIQAANADEAIAILKARPPSSSPISRCRDRWTG